MRKKPARVLAMLFLTAFLIGTPFLVRGRLHVDEYRAYHTQPAPAWKGRLEIWHVASFRTAQGSVTDYLQSRADAYCRTRAGVDIDVVGLTEKKLNDRLARGAFPGAYSFQTGLLYAEQLAPIRLETPDLRGGLSPETKGDAVLCVPYLMSGYFLAGNELLMGACGLAMPKQIDKAFLSAALTANAKQPQLETPALIAAQYALTGTFAEAGSFLAGKAAFAILDARALTSALHDPKANLSVSAIPLSPFTDEVFYIGASRTASAEERAALGGFVAFLLSDDEQRRLPLLGALPVTNVDEVVFANASCEALHQALSSPVAPAPFAFHQHKSALLSEAERALGGDAEAQKAFLARLDEVLGGA